MSILLDSLRKSEAQRKIKDAPTIHSADAHGSRRRRPGRWPAPAMIVLTAAAIAWFGWRQFTVPEGGNGEIPSVAAEQGAVAGPEAGPLPERDLPAESAPPRNEGRTPVERLSQAEAAHPADGTEPTSPADRVAAFTAPREAPEGGEPYEEGGESSGDEFADEGDPLAVAEDSPAEAVDDFPELEPPAAERRRRAEAVEAGPRSYWQLPQSWRNEMPEFRISVLVYAESAGDRFLLMNGERLREGDELEGGIVLEEIRRDGAVFSYRQTRFVVKS